MVAGFQSTCEDFWSVAPQGFSRAFGHGVPLVSCESSLFVPGSRHSAPVATAAPTPTGPPFFMGCVASTLCSAKPFHFVLVQRVSFISLVLQTCKTCQDGPPPRF
jgi:hypothetical protein